MVGKDGITEDARKAQSFIVVKQMPDNRFERLDYVMKGSLQKRRTYKDKAMQILDGPYMEYLPDGKIHIKGMYVDNQREGHWFTFNDTGGVSISQQYKLGQLLPEEHETKKTPVEDSLGSEAEFKGGNQAWQKYLIKCLEKSNAPEQAARGGKVWVSFEVDTLGFTRDIFISRSVDYFLDEEAIKVISKSPPWIPALQNGRKVKAWRRQPFTFAIE